MKWLDNSRAIRTDEGYAVVSVKYMLCLKDAYWFLMSLVKPEEKH